MVNFETFAATREQAMSYMDSTFWVINTLAVVHDETSAEYCERMVNGVETSITFQSSGNNRKSDMQKVMIRVERVVNDKGFAISKDVEVYEY